MTWNNSKRCNTGFYWNVNVCCKWNWSFFIIFVKVLSTKLYFIYEAARLGYGSACTATSDCQSGYTCTTNGYLCNCPASLSAYKCDCTYDQYYLAGTGCGIDYLIIGFHYNHLEIYLIRLI